MTNTIDVPVTAPNQDLKGMPLEEARQVLWIKENPRPMGELVDGGFLTVDKLEWAVRYAFSSRVQAAATTLLRVTLSVSAPASPACPVSPAAPFPAPMTLEAARQVPWPYREIKGRPMGALLDERLLTSKDLGYALDNSPTSRVRQAAATLLLDRLARVEPPAGPMCVVKSDRRTFAEAHQLQLVLLGGVGAGLVGGGTLIALMWWLVSYGPFWLNPKTLSVVFSPAGLLALGSLAVVGWLLDRAGNAATTWSVDRFDREVRHYRQGQLGEDRATEALRAQLDAQWTLYRNLTLPGRKGGDLDAVLVGPTGIWVLEVKNYTGSYRLLRNRWELKTQRGWERLRKSPSDQARRNAARLHDFLEASDIAQFVKGVVVWANPDSPLETGESDVLVWRVNQLEAPLQTARANATLRPDQLVRIKDLLHKMTLTDPEA